VREIETKGQSIRSLLGAIEALWGADVLRRTIDACPPDVRTGLTDGRMVSGGWYPVGWYREVHTAIRTVIPNEPNISARLGRKTTELDLQGPLRWCLQLAGPDLLARFADKVHSSYFRGGKIEAFRERGQLTLRMSDMHGMNKHMWDDLVAGSAVLFEAAARHPVLHRVQGGTGSSVEFTLIWDEAKMTGS
jgi:hypothetical protein